MSMLASMARQVVGLFIDDGSLALSILGVIAMSAAIGVLMPGAQLLAGGVLLVGCLAALVINTSRAARR